MGLKEVYLSLRDAFPQVDTRILKAVAIEHEKDADAAAEFIIAEVLPSLDSTPVQGPSSTSDSMEVQRQLPIVPDSPPVQGLSSTSDSMEVQRQLPIVPGMIVHEKMSSNLGNLVQTGDQDSSSEPESVSSLHLEAGSVERGASHAISQDPKTSAYIPVPSTDDSQNVGNQIFHGDDEKQLESPSDLLPNGGKDSPTFFEMHNVPTIFDLAYESEVHNGILLDEDIQQQPTTITTGSGQIVSIDFLEDLVDDAKSNKKTLVSAMECIISLGKEVELRERDVSEAKYEAEKAGMDIMARVDDLKKMLAHAKETNYMHTGEVYGEKSILATEARELQSRLLSLSGQRDKSLSIIEEMRVMLEARLAAAEAERMTATEERLRKEENALKELHEQENIMDMVIQESKKLMHEAEENSKLRDFLMDRGRVVDELQGEIAVVCEDILALKDKIDRRIPFSIVLHSSQLSSSGSSLSPKNDSLSEPSEHQAFSCNVPIQDFPESENAREKAVTALRDLNVPLDDDWDLFEADTELKNQVLINIGSPSGCLYAKHLGGSYIGN